MCRFCQLQLPWTSVWICYEPAEIFVLHSTLYLQSFIYDISASFKPYLPQVYFYSWIFEELLYSLFGILYFSDLRFAHLFFWYTWNLLSQYLICTYILRRQARMAIQVTVRWQSCFGCASAQLIFWYTSYLRSYFLTRNADISVHSLLSMINPTPIHPLTAYFVLIPWAWTSLFIQPVFYPGSKPLGGKLTWL